MNRAGAPPGGARAGGADGIDLLIGLAVGGVLCVSVVQWLIGNLASLLRRARPLPATPVDAAASLPGLPHHLTNPAASWPAASRRMLPGPALYWTATLLVLAALLAAAWAGMAWWGRHRQVPIDKRRRLGVDTQPRLATRRDLATLYIRRPEPGRFLLARYGRGYLATEAPTTSAAPDTPPAGSRPPSGQRSQPPASKRPVAGAVAVFGPSQSGKTTGLLDGISSWTGAAIISSVKADLYRATHAARAEVGEVRLFDPLGVTGQPSHTWSPLRGAATLTGALNAAGILARTGDNDQAAGGDRFWRGQAEQLLAAMLFTAANTQRTMSDVVRWVLDLDRPSNDNAGTLAPLVRLIADHDDPQVAMAGKQVQGWLHGQWDTDPRTTSSVYATARNAVWPWADPAIATSAATCTLTLDWLRNSHNTLYLLAPLGDDTRLGTVFAAVLHDLITDAFAHYNRQGAPLDPRLLVVCDEAANTPLPKLPQWAATVSGAGIQLITVWQSLAQLRSIYAAQTDSVLTNHRSKVFYPSGLTDAATSEQLSQLLGTEHVRSDLTAPAGSLDPMAAPSATAVPYATADVLRRLNTGDALLLHGPLPPALLPASGRRRR